MNKRTALLKNLTASRNIEGALENMGTQTHPNVLTTSAKKEHLLISKNRTTALEDKYLAVLASEIKKAAQILDVQESAIRLWLECYGEVPTHVQLVMLRIISKSGLDPFLDELAFTKYENADWEAMITINGWARLMNHHPTFSGIEFKHSPEYQDEIPLWIECTIYRNDRLIPTTVREYFSEVKGESEIWKKMPRRMLRHRAFQQCAKMALGI